MSQAPQKFPQPWRVEDTEGAFLVKDAAGTLLARVDFTVDGPPQSKDEARRMADNMVAASEIISGTGAL